MKTLLLVSYYIWAGLSFVSLPLVELVMSVVLRTKYNLPGIYKEWKDHYDSGESWGGLDKGRNL